MRWTRKVQYFLMGGQLIFSKIKVPTLRRGPEGVRLREVQLYSAVAPLGAGGSLCPPPPQVFQQQKQKEKQRYYQAPGPSETQGILLSKAVKRRLVFFPSKAICSTEWLLNFQALVNSPCERLANGIERFGLSNMELTGTTKNQLFKSGTVLALIFVCY